MTASEFPPGIDREVWEEVEWGDWALTMAEERMLIGSPYRYFVRRDPKPTMPPLPDEPGAVIRAVGEALEDAALQHLGRDLGTAHRDDIARAAIEAVAAAFGVEELREALSEWRKGRLPAPAFHQRVEHVLARVDEAVGS